MRRALALLLSLTILTTGCATARPSVGSAAWAAPVAEAQATADRGTIAAFARQLPVGSRVRVTLATKRTIRGTLMGANERSVTLQPRTRIMEPAIEVPLDQIVGIDVETPNNVGRAIAIGVGTGAATALGVFLLILAIAVND